MPTAEVHHCHLAKASSTMVLARWILGFSNCSRRTHPPGIGRDLGERWNWNSTVHRLFCEPFSNERKILKGGSGCHQRWRVFLVLKVTNMTKPTPQNPPNQPGVVFFSVVDGWWLGLPHYLPCGFKKDAIAKNRPPSDGAVEDLEDDFPSDNLQDSSLNFNILYVYIYSYIYRYVHIQYEFSLLQL